MYKDASDQRYFNIIEMMHDRHTIMSRDGFDCLCGYSRSEVWDVDYLFSFYEDHKETCQRRCAKEDSAEALRS